MDKDTEREVEKRIRRSACFQRAFSGPDGELALKELRLYTGFDGDAFNPDPAISAYNAGRRSVFVFVNNIISQDVEEAKKKLGEKHERQM